MVKKLKKDTVPESANEKIEVDQVQEKEVEKKRIIECERAAENSGSFCLVYRDDLTIYPGRLLEVGKDINEDEAADLLSLTTFKFKEVTK
ncbi:hypothetical protein [Bacillus mycoides]|uniref:hypothetical protein n=1 Tax=Bacillus mycoides TaxID=1405 RepID=UPI0025A21CF5|nr:hypothetical protein [Bacillus mycoides]MDM5430811.1 hypothetical protein [Bacillus mycoides]